MIGAFPIPDYDISCSLSKDVTTTLLRGNLGFPAAFVTDRLEMDAQVVCRGKRRPGGPGCRWGRRDDLSHPCKAEVGYQARPGGCGKREVDPGFPTGKLHTGGVSRVQDRRRLVECPLPGFDPGRTAQRAGVHGIYGTGYRSRRKLSTSGGGPWTIFTP